jgi:hypothetical protein
MRSAPLRATRRRFAGCDVGLCDEGPRQQIYLGDESFVERMQAMAEGARAASPEVPRAQRRAPLRLGPAGAGGESREQALLRAHVERGITMTAPARGLGLSVSRVSRLLARAEAQRQNASALAVASGLARWPCNVWDRINPSTVPTLMDLNVVREVKGSMPGSRHFGLTS